MVISYIISVRIYILIFLFVCINLTTAQDFSNISKRFDDALSIDNQNKLNLAIKEYKKIVLDAPGYSITYRHLIRTYIKLKKEEEALSFFSDLIKSDSTNGYAYYCLSRICSQRGNYNQAIIYLRKCIHYNPDYAEAYGYYFGLGRIYQILGDTENAIKYYQKAILLPSEAKSVIFHSLSEILKLYLEKRDYIKFDRYLELMIKYADKENDTYFKAWAYSNYGYYKIYLGEYRNALSYLLKSIVVSNDPEILGISYGNIGAVYNYLGENERSLLYLKKQLAISEDYNLHNIRKFALINIGFMLIEKNEYDESLKYFNNIFNSANKKNNDWFIFRALQGIADSYFYMHRYDEAESYYFKALKVSENLYDYFSRADILLNIGDFYTGINNLKKSIKYFKKSIEVCNEGKLNVLKWKSEVGLGLDYYKYKDSEKAIDHFNNAISVFDRERKSINPDFIGDSFFKKRYVAYFYLIKLYVQNGRFSDAFHILEKYKASSLISLDNNKNINVINNKIEETHLKISKFYLSHSIDTTKIFKLQEQIAELELKKSYYQDSLNTNQNFISLENVMKAVSGSNKTLIQFMVGDESTIIFAINKDSVVYKEIDISRDELALLLHNISNMFRLEKSKELDYNTNIINTQMANFNAQSLYKAYRILIEPLNSFIKKSDELIIIPDDLLFYLPFDALVTSTKSKKMLNDFSNVRFLVENYNISYASSASVLFQKLKIKRQETEYDLLAMGNPDFSEMEIKDTLSINSKSYNRGMKNLLPLPYAQAEVSLIGDIIGPIFSKVFINIQATEDNFMAYAGKSRILHLATHFMTNDQDPSYSNIALARNGNCKEDGLLQPFEISNMRLNADLAVLSACNTALGKIKKGEGLVGISSAFRDAGVPSLVVSQWNVDDKATSLIMTSFYKYLKRGFTKNYALHQAKLDFLKSSEKEYKNPFYWAPFILIGNTQHITFHKTYYSLYAFALTIIFFVIFLWWIQKKFSS